MKDFKSYLIGSHKYGTATENSDYDYIYIVDEIPSTGPSVKDHYNRDVQLMTQESFDFGLENHDVQILEAVYLNDQVPKSFRINPGKLRTSFSTVSNHSWVKGKKKLTVFSDYEKDIGLKSIFHSIRILDFGIQLIVDNDIVDPTRYSWLMENLRELGEKYEREELWNVIESKYKALFKDLRSKFKGLAPKELTQKGLQKSTLINTLVSHKVIPKKQLVKDILEIFE